MDGGGQGFNEVGGDGGRPLTVAVLSPLTGGFYFGGILTGIARELGIAAAPPGRVTGDDVLRDADHAMYRAKATRRGSWALHRGR